LSGAKTDGVSSVAMGLGVSGSRVSDGALCRISSRRSRAIIFSFLVLRLAIAV
jgi:hypothetical protein